MTLLISPGPKAPHSQPLGKRYPHPAKTAWGQAFPKLLLLGRLVGKSQGLAVDAAQQTSS
jgi:hypothetical protein